VVPFEDESFEDTSAYWFFMTWLAVTSLLLARNCYQQVKNNPFGFFRSEKIISTDDKDSSMNLSEKLKK
jgi:hypothetical protein